MSNWYVNTQPGPPFPGGTAYGGGGAVQYRNPLDAERAAKGVMPHAQYPDGYLGTITDRQGDKLLQAVQNRLTERSYQRGVHKGEKIASSDYFWDRRVVDPDSRLKKEISAQQYKGMHYVQRYAPTGNPVERLAHMGKTAGMSAAEESDVYRRYGVSIAKNPVVIQDPGRKERMQKMLPGYVI